MADILDCPICLETISGRVVQCLNGHTFCGGCLDEITQHITAGTINCPVCRIPMSKRREIRNTLVENLIKECVGSQDQVSAAYGGFNEIEFYKDGSFSVEPIMINPERKKSLNDHLMLFFTGISRLSSVVAESQLSNMRN